MVHDFSRSTPREKGNGAVSRLYATGGNPGHNNV